MATTVINIKDAPKGWEKDSQYVYIGRQGYGWDGTWGNPYVLRKEIDRNKILNDYMLWFYKQPDEWKDRLYNATVDKILVCFCKPKMCHGDIIASYVNVIKQRKEFYSNESQ